VATGSRRSRGRGGESAAVTGLPGRAVIFNRLI